jgi:hypothetical protein
LSLGRVRSLDEGLGEFALRLGQALVYRVKHQSPHQPITLHFHARKKLHGCLGNVFVYHEATRLQRWFHLSHTRYDVWHCLHQLNTTLPAMHSKTVLLTVHDLNFLYLDSPEQIQKRIKKTRRILQRADHIAAISDHTKTDLQKTFANLNCPVSVIFFPY